METARRGASVNWRSDRTFVHLRFSAGTDLLSRSAPRRGKTAIHSARRVSARAILASQTPQNLDEPRPVSRPTFQLPRVAESFQRSVGKCQCRPDGHAGRLHATPPVPLPFGPGAKCSDSETTQKPWSFMSCEPGSVGPASMFTSLHRSHPPVLTGKDDFSRQRAVAHIDLQEIPLKLLEVNK